MMVNHTARAKKPRIWDPLFRMANRVPASLMKRYVA